MTTTRKFAAVLAAAAFIPLAACGTDGTATIAAPAPVAETAASPVDTDDVFLQVLRDRGIPANSASIEAAHAVCDALDAGATIVQVISASVEGYGSSDGAYVAGAGIAAYCPQYSDELKSLGGDPA
ncbi:DUF732 domain-containing protein [Gordonia sp. (in: high G+C Gram-positive bacteria)]|uniref:DUF732 domain-containing protein n=1 Tax=Gordonia sp. (in: high G+C Gram-positive bacteria) TaxID=84139 RepID=UPI003F9B5D71